MAGVCADFLGPTWKSGALLSFLKLVQTPLISQENLATSACGPYNEVIATVMKPAVTTLDLQGLATYLDLFVCLMAGSGLGADKWDNMLMLRLQIFE